MVKQKDFLFSEYTNTLLRRVEPLLQRTSWNQQLLSSIERCPLLRGWVKKTMYVTIIDAIRNVSLIGVSFIGGSTVHHYLLYLDTLMSFKSSKRILALQKKKRKKKAILSLYH